MANLTYTVAIDFDDNGCWTDANEDVTGDVINMEWRRGRDRPHHLSGRSRAGRARLTLRNDDDKYSPLNASSPLTGNLVPGRPIRIQTTGAGSIGTRWQGFVESIIPGARSGAVNTVTFNCVGSLGFIANREAEIAMQTSITIDSAIGLLLDEIGWPKDEQYDNEVNADSPAGYWRFNESSGDAQDETANNNDGTIDVAGGVTQGVTGLLGSSTDKAIELDGTTSGSRVNFGDQTEHRNIFDGGGTLECLIDADSDGLSSQGYIWDKSHYLRVQDESASAMRLLFQVNFSGANGIWRTTDRPIKVGTSHHIVVVYDADSVSNNPTFYIDGCAYTVGDGLTEQSTPTGTRLTDSGSTMYVGNRDGGDKTFDGTIDEFAMYSSTLSAARIEVHYKAVRTWRDLDTAKTTMNRWWVDRTTITQALRALEETENGFIYEKKDGSIAFRHGHDRFANRTSDATFSDAAAAALTYQSISQRDPDRSIYNILDTEVQLFSVGGSATLWAYADTVVPYIAPAETETFIARYPVNDSPTQDVGVDAWTTSAENTDYDANSLEAGGGTDLSSSLTVVNTKFGESMEIAITNDHATLGAFLVDSGGNIVLQARGTPVQASDPIAIREEDTTSQGDYGDRTYQARRSWFPSVIDARSWAKVNLDLYKDPEPSISIQVPGNRTAGTLTELEDRDINDRITVKADGNAGLGFDQDWFIESERHMVRNMLEHRVVWDLSDTAGYDLYWQLDVSALGTNTKLGR